AVETIQQRNYSGGSQVQGPEAMELLRALPLAPVSLAIQSQQVEILCELLNKGEVYGVKEAYITNSQSKNVIVELK
ncbi:aminotransferase, partial [Staphylococcus sp. SIMBA_130]